MFSSTMAPKWPILVSQCGMDHQKPTILLIFGTLSLGGCGGHPMRPKLNLKDKSHMSTPNEYTDNLKSNLICIFPRYELRRCVRARTRAMCGRTCACACEIHSGKCARCACVRPFFVRAMCDHTFAHFFTLFGTNCQKMLLFVSKIF